MNKDIRNYIDGIFVDPKNESYLDNYSPATGQVYSKLPDSTAIDIDHAVASAKEASKAWQALSVQKRSEYLIKIAKLIKKYSNELALAETIDQGKPLSLSKKMDIPRAIANFEFFATAILHDEDQAYHDQHSLNYTVRQAVGVCGLISPWNLPLYLLTWKIAPALAVGNTVVCKPSEFTPMTAYMLAQVVHEAGLPGGVCNIVFGRGEVAGRTLVKHPDVPLISFTGGGKTATTIMKDSAFAHKKLSLELGGKNPNIIFSDCDLEQCLATSVRSSFLNQGEICLCGSRIFVEKKIYPLFLKNFIEYTKKIRVGDPVDEKTDCGAVVSKHHMNKILSYIDLAKEEGGNLVCGGKRVFLQNHHKEGYFIEPTIITNLSNESKVMQEEIFGPVVTVTPFGDMDQLVEWANSTTFGLSASIWTKDLRQAQQLSKELAVGQVWINCWLKRDLRVPFGGVKASGLGREGGRYSLNMYTETKNICMDLS